MNHINSMLRLYRSGAVEYFNIYRKIGYSIFLLLIPFYFSTRLIAQPALPVGFSLAAAGTATAPTGIVFSKDGKKMFVWEKGGIVYLFNHNSTNNTYVKQATPVLNISEETGNWQDHGLLGFALDPNFAVNGRIYLAYVVDRHYLMNFGTLLYNSASNEYFNATIGRITRYTTVMSGSNLVASVSSRRILLGETKSTGLPILSPTHGVGTLVFGADGSLLASMGEGAGYTANDMGSSSSSYYQQALADGIIRTQENVGALRAQMINSLSGKILRIDPETGNGIPGNPFYNSSQPRSPRSRVWALGFRNPYRMCLKPGTGSTARSDANPGTLILGDVGMNTFEEINIISKAGLNCGWPLYEGLTAHPGFIKKNIPNGDEPNPLYNQGGCTQQFFTFDNLLKQVTADGNPYVYNPCSPYPVITGGNPARFVHHRAALDYIHSGTPTARVGTFSGNNATVANIGTSASGVQGTPFIGRAAIGGIWYSGNKYPLQYQNTYLVGDYNAKWIKRFTFDVNNKLKIVSEFITNFPGYVQMVQNPLDGYIYMAALQANTIYKLNYTANKPPVVILTSDKTYGKSPLTVRFTGDKSYDPEKGILTYAWDFGDGQKSVLANPSHTYNTGNNTPTKYVVKLTVKDNQNASSSASTTISVNNTPPVVNITSPVDGSKYKVGENTEVALVAAVTDSEHLDYTLKYEWQTILRHNDHQHAEPIDTNHVTRTTIVGVGCDGETYYYLITLKVSDNAGLSSTDFVRLYPECSGGITLLDGLSSIEIDRRPDEESIDQPISRESVVSPNPFSNELNIQSHFDTTGSLRVRIVNANGNPVYNSEQQVKPGINIFTISNLQHIPPGLYILEMSLQNATKRVKLIKLR